MAAPSAADVRLDFGDGTFATAEVVPTYEQVYPNGEDCDEGCAQAEMVIDVPPIAR